MKLITLTLLLSLTSALAVDYKHIDFDEKTDFSKLKTFSLREGKINTTAPELTSELSRQRMADVLRAEFKAKGLSEAQRGADLTVTYELATIMGRGTTPGDPRDERPQPFQYVEANLIIELLRNDSQPIWRGVYRDDEREPGRFARNLPEHIKKLLSEFPPKKKS